MNNKKNQFVMKVGDNFQRFYSIKQELIEEVRGFTAISMTPEEEIPFDWFTHLHLFHPKNIRALIFQKKNKKNSFLLLYEMGVAV